MCESEQTINVSEWKELHAELEEVRDKRNRLQTENNRLKTLIQLTQKECDESKNELRDMTAQRDHATAVWRECCEDRSRQVTSLREQLAEMTAERDKALSNAESLRADYRAAKEAANTNSDIAATLREHVAGMNIALNEMREQRNAMELSADQMRGLMDAARNASSEVQQQLVQMTAERDAAWSKVEIVITERDAAERERTESRAEVVQLQVERDAARKFADDTQVELGQLQAERDAVSEQLSQAKEVADMFEAENKSLQDTVRQLRAKQIHDDLPGLLCAIQLAAEQARELI